MGVPARIVAAFFATVGICALSSASPAPDTGAVLYTVARNYCSHNKPSVRLLNSKVARINDIPESRSMLRDFFGDPELVDAFFRQNTEAAQLPKGDRYACYQLSENGSYALSLPVFSKSGSEAFVYFADNCPALCGHGELYVLHMAGRRWRVSKRIPLWVS
jgi:hypothetical protein